jgi:hypothetical protein
MLMLLCSWEMLNGTGWLLRFATSSIVENMADEYENDYTSSETVRRRRPSRRVAQSSAGPTEPALLTEEFPGLSLAYGNTLLFVGYEVNGLVEITVYPRYRFSSDDRVQGHLGYVRVPFGTPWEEIIPQVDDLFDMAQTNYRTAVTLRSNSARAQGAGFEAAYSVITDIFRESWHGFSLRLRREDKVVKDGVTFSGKPPGPVLAVWRGESYTVQVFTTGSICMVRGDQRKRMEQLSVRA